LFKPILKPSSTAAALLSDRTRPAKNSAKKATINAKNPSIIARRISLTKNTQPNQPRDSTSSDHKVIFEKNRGSSGSTNQSVSKKRKFATSLVGLPQYVSPLSQHLKLESRTDEKPQNLKIFAKSLLSSASSSAKKLNFNHSSIWEKKLSN
jgi:hypothetical protein